MARTVALSELQTRVLQRADAENDTHIATSELTGLINDAITTFYDRLIENAPPDYFRTTNTFTTSANTIAYSLPSDFYKVRQVYMVDDTNVYRPLSQVDEVSRYSFRPTDGTYTVRLDYIPVATRLVNSGDTIDGVNGWDELVVLQAAIDIKNKKEDDPSALMQKMAIVEDRIRKLSDRDPGAPRHVVKRRYFDSPRWRRGWPSMVTNRVAVDGYLVVGSNIELYRYEGICIP